jgi:hypothetical protein
MRQFCVKLGLAFVPVLCGCAAAKFYKAPVANFQSGVNETASTVEPYFTELNRMESQYRLFDKVHDSKDWGTEDLKPRFSPETIQVRVQALEIIKRYAQLLSDIAGSTSPDDFQKAADNLGKQTQSLADTVGKLAGAKVPPIGDPLGKLVNFLGQIKIEHDRKKALEVAIKAGEGPVDELIQALRDDTVTAVALWYEDQKQREVIVLGMYNAQRKSATSPDAIEALMKKVLDNSNEAETLRNLPVRNLFDDFESAHKALVSFAKSGGRPSGVAGLAAQIDVFTQQAKTLSDLVLSLRNVKTAS